MICKCAVAHKAKECLLANTGFFRFLQKENVTIMIYRILTRVSITRVLSESQNVEDNDKERSIYIYIYIPRFFLSKSSLIVIN